MKMKRGNLSERKMERKKEEITCLCEYERREIRFCRKKELKTTENKTKRMKAFLRRR